MSEDGDDKGFLTAKQLAACGCFDGAPSSEELERCFFLDDEDRKLVAKRRGDANRLGFALQLTTVRFLGTFLDDPLDVPSVVLDELAGQLVIADPSCVKTYVERANTRWEHRREICRVDGWREFASVREELSRWIDHRAWTTGAGPKAIFDGVITWLRQRQVLLPAVKELERLVSRVVREAHARLWSTLADLLTAQQARLLLDLLEVPDDRRFSRRGPVDRTGKALVAALNRVARVAGIGLGEVDLGVVPARRVVELARRGMTSNATDLRRTMPYSKRLATLLATVVYLEAKATDDALELFDVIMTSELLARAERQSNADKLSRYARLGKDASRLASAVSVLLEAEEWDGTITIDVLWDAIESVATRAELRASVASIHQILPPDADPEGEWRSALLSRYPLVRKFLRLLAETIEFGATTDAAPVLDALKALPALLDVGPTKRIPAGFLDARKVAIDVVTPGWRELVLPRGRPPETVDRVAYVFCVLDQFHQRLRRRDIFAVASSRWADPRAQLLSGQAWESARESLMDSLQLPEDPDELLTECARELDAMWWHIAARAADGDITVDEQGRVHAAALKAIPEPATLVDLRRRCQAMMPRVDIGELILEVMGWHPQFTTAYTHVSGGGTRISDNLDIAASSQHRIKDYYHVHRRSRPARSRLTRCTTPARYPVQAEARVVPRSTPPQARPTLREAVDAFVSSARCANPNTRRAYADVLDRVLENLGPDRLLAELPGDELAGMFATAWGQAAPATWNRNRAAVSSWLTWCAKNRWLAPALPPLLERRPERADQTKALPRAAIERQLSRRDVPLREKTLWRMLYETAARASEILALDIDDLDLPGRRAKVTSKGGDTEWVHWASGTAHLLPRLIRDRGHGPVFISHRRPGSSRRPTSRDLCPDTGKARLGYDRARILLATYTGWELHQLRHSAATHLGEKNVPLQTIMAKTRHRNPRTAMRYIRPSAEAVAQVTELLDLGRHHH